MKILWFTNSPSLADNYLGKKTVNAGWISSMEECIRNTPEIELAISFNYVTNQNISNFEIDKTQYFPVNIPSAKGKFSGLLSRWFHRIEPDNFIEKYVDVINEFKPDIIHIFGTENAFGLVANYVNEPIIIQIQGNLSAYLYKWFSGICFNGILRNSQKKNIVLAYGIFHEFFLFRKRAKREQLIFKNCRYYIGRTNWDRRIVNVLATKSTYFHCDEVLRSEFYQAEWKQPDGIKSVFVSTISPTSYKGLESVLEVAFLLKTKSVDFQWNIVGVSGKEEIVYIIEKALNLNFLEGNICFKGALDEKGLIDELMSASCYIHPSHIENSPNSVCEAMMLGMPVIATFAGGTSTLITNNENGVLIQDGDPYSMTGTILELITNMDTAVEMGKKARITALKRHNSEKITSDLLKIYKTVLSKNDGKKIS